MVTEVRFTLALLQALSGFGFKTKRVARDRDSGGAQQQTGASTLARSSFPKAEMETPKGLMRKDQTRKPTKALNLQLKAATSKPKPERLETGTWKG